MELQSLVAAVPLRRLHPAAIYAPTVFLSAWLLFQVEPLFVKMALPLLGGSPAVWTTALVVFQALLLAGYLYAHWLVTRFRPYWQRRIHLSVLFAALVALPIAIPNSWRTPLENAPNLWLIGLVAVSIGLPFFAISANAPLLQRWFAGTADASAQNPYPLYAASNLGSLVALLAYPFLIEPFFALRTQSWVWSAGYGALLAAALVCALRSAIPSESAVVVKIPQNRAAAPSWRRRIHWAALAFVPSGMLVSVTTIITSEIAPIPLLWIAPLALYLLSFVIVFARRQWFRDSWLQWIQAGLLLLSAVFAVRSLTSFSLAIMMLGLATLFATSLILHRELVKLKPSVQHLTEFYVWMSVGGILGSTFAALWAPLLFNFFVEYAILIVLAGLLRPATDRSEESRQVGYRFGAATVLREVSVPAIGLSILLLINSRVSQDTAAANAMFGMILLFIALFSVLSAGRPFRFGLCLAAIAAFGASMSNPAVGALVYRERTFYGIHAIRTNSSGDYIVLTHGNTIHGAQHTSWTRYRERNTYFHADSGIGRAMQALDGKAQLPKSVGVIGLGAGELSCYRQDGQHWTFFEIDPAVVFMATSGQHFRFVPTCAPDARILVGDGRLLLAREPAGQFDLLIIDAFGSDTIPFHLATREAFRLYTEKLTANGVILMHISNRFIDLEPVVSRLAVETGLAARIMIAKAPHANPEQPYRFGSIWVALSRNEAALKAMTEDQDAESPSAWGAWRKLKYGTKRHLWTDDYSNLLSVLK